MIFGKKTDKGDKSRLPDLPAPKYSMGGAVISPPIGRRDIESLPSFPDSPNDNSFSQAAIKDAINDSNDESSNENEHDEMEEWKPSKFNADSITSHKLKNTFEEGENEAIEEQDIEEESNEDEQNEEIEKEIPEEEYNKIERNAASKSKNDDIFVKIDKFHSARRTLHDIREKLEEINGLLKKVRETRLREEQELAAWEKELISAKNRIQNVTENIFEKVD